MQIENYMACVCVGPDKILHKNPAHLMNRTDPSKWKSAYKSLKTNKVELNNRKSDKKSALDLIKLIKIGKVTEKLEEVPVQTPRKKPKKKKEKRFEETQKEVIKKPKESQKENLPILPKETQEEEMKAYTKRSSTKRFKEIQKEEINLANRLNDKDPRKQFLLNKSIGSVAVLSFEPLARHKVGVEPHIHSEEVSLNKINNKGFTEGRWDRLGRRMRFIKTSNKIILKSVKFRSVNDWIEESRSLPESNIQGQWRNHAHQLHWFHRYDFLTNDPNGNIWNFEKFFPIFAKYTGKNYTLITPLFKRRLLRGLRGDCWL